MIGPMEFESRTARLNYPAGDIYNFITDIRNLGRFIPADSVSNLEIKQDSCSFRITILGDVTIRIKEKVPGKKVIFDGNAPKINDFSLRMDINDSGEAGSEVKVTVSAEMNALMRMVAAEPVKQFLETLMREMERFTDWKNVI